MPRIVPIWQKSLLNTGFFCVLWLRYVMAMSSQKSANPWKNPWNPWKDPWKAENPFFMGFNYPFYVVPVIPGYLCYFPVIKKLFFRNRSKHFMHPFKNKLYAAVLLWIGKYTVLHK